MNLQNNFFLVLQDAFLALVRITVGFAMLTHGFPKLQTLLEGGDIQFYNFLGLGASFSLGCAVFAEFVCSIFLILGLFSRWATFFLAFTMFIAAFFVHGEDPFAKQEMSILYLLVYALLFIFGPGKYSIDFLITKRKNSIDY